MDRKSNFQELERLIRKSSFNDSIPDFEKFWNMSYNKGNRKEDYMAEKSGGIKILVWLVGFMIIVGVGWFGFTNILTKQKQEKIQKGEAIVVTLVVGKVDVKKMGASEYREVMVEDTLQMGDSLKTAKDSYCELQMVQRGIFRVESSSDLLIAKLVNEDDKVNSRMKLAKGGIALKPNKLKTGENFEVETSTAVAAVRGTKFSVNVDEMGNTKVAVNEGKVAVSPMINSINEAKDKGQVDEKAAETLKKDIVKPIEVNPGQEATLDTKKVEALDKAIGKAIQETAKKEGGQITGEKMTAPAPVVKNGVAEQAPSLITSSIVAQVKKDMPVDKTAGAQKSDPVTSAIVEKQKISEEAKAKLDTLKEENIIAKATDMIKIRFESNPAGAEIFVDNISIGLTPAEQIFEKGKKISVKISKSGFADALNSLDVTSSQTFNSVLSQTQASVAEGNKVPGGLDWEKPITVAIGSPDNEPVLYKGKIYTTLNNKLMILTTEGEVLKAVAVVEDGFKLTRPAVSDGLVYVGSDNGGLYAYDTAGIRAWKADAGSEKYGAAPTAAYGIVAVPSIEKGIKIYSKEGALVNSIDIQTPIYSAPLILDQGKTLVYATESGEINSYDLTKNVKLWSKNYNERFLYPLVGDDTIVTLARKDGKIMGISASDGSMVWNTQYAEIQRTKINPQYVNGKVVFANNGESSATVIVIGASKGNLLAKVKLTESISVPFLVGNSVYFGTLSGKVYSYNLQKQDYDWTYPGKDKISMVVGDQDSVYAISSSQMMKLIK
jgi:outer membrane protein assembly factor BamB